MVKTLLNSIFCLLLILPVNAQDVPWQIKSGTVTANKANVIIKATPTVNGVSLKNGDYVGVFDSIGNCYGLKQWKDTAYFEIIVNGSSDGKSGLTNGSPYQFKLWIKSEDCIVDNMIQLASTDSLNYNPSTTSEITSLNFERISVNYPIQSTCINSGISLTPIINYNPERVQFSYNASLRMDTATGIINPALSLPGTYPITMNAGKYCLVSKSSTIVIRDLPHITHIPDTLVCENETITLSIPARNDSIAWSNGVRGQRVVVAGGDRLSYTVTDEFGCTNFDSVYVRKTVLKNINYQTESADCDKKAKLTIVDQDIENGRPPYSYSIKNIIDSSVLTDIDAIPEGIYEVSVVNANGCTLKKPGTILLEKNCLNDIPVFTPNADGLDDRYFINLNGQIRIYDRNGKLRRNLTGPIYFDGNDENGKPLPMGTYLIVSAGGKNITLTIIK